VEAACAVAIVGTAGAPGFCWLYMFMEAIVGVEQFGQYAALSFCIHETNVWQKISFS
jgi:hypothetical protein